MRNRRTKAQSRDDKSGEATDGAIKTFWREKRRSRRRGCREKEGASKMPGGKNERKEEERKM